MSPATHFLAGWIIAGAARLSFRDRALITVCGVAPDLDALGIITEIAFMNTNSPLNWYSRYHHVLCHNAGFGLLLIFIVLLFAERRGAAAFLSLVAFHLHLFFDLIGSRGPDGYQWPIPYLLPFSNRWQLTWQGQWSFNAWPNTVFTMLLVAVAGYLAWKRGYSPLEMISKKANVALVSRLRSKFGKPDDRFV